MSTHFSSTLLLLIQDRAPVSLAYIELIDPSLEEVQTIPQSVSLYKQNVVWYSLSTVMPPRTKSNTSSKNSNNNNNNSYNSRNNKNKHKGKGQSDSQGGYQGNNYNPAFGNGKNQNNQNQNQRQNNTNGNYQHGKWSYNNNDNQMPAWSDPADQRLFNSQMRPVHMAYGIASDTERLAEVLRPKFDGRGNIISTSDDPASWLADQISYGGPDGQEASRKEDELEDPRSEPNGDPVLNCWANSILAAIRPEILAVLQPVELRIVLQYLFTASAPEGPSIQFDNKALFNTKSARSVKWKTGLGTAHVDRIAEIFYNENRFEVNTLEELNQFSAYVPAPHRQNVRRLVLGYEILQVSNWDQLDGEGFTTQDKYVLEALLRFENLEVIHFQVNWNFNKNRLELFRNICIRYSTLNDVKIELPRDAAGLAFHGLGIEQQLKAACQETVGWIRSDIRLKKEHQEQLRIKYENGGMMYC